LGATHPFRSFLFSVISGLIGTAGRRAAAPTAPRLSGGHSCTRLHELRLIGRSWCWWFARTSPILRVGGALSGCRLGAEAKRSAAP
jgi:hypothetical protein